MKYFFMLIFAWYLQDIAQVIMTQTFLAPEFYALALTCCATVDDVPCIPYRWIAAAVIGGVLYDLRWVGIPGVSSAIYLAMLFAVRRMWYHVPSSNRRMLPFTVIIGCSLLLITPLRLVFWDFSVLRGRVVLILAVQWILSGAALLIVSLLRTYNYDEL